MRIECAEYFEKAVASAMRNLRDCVAMGSDWSVEWIGMLRVDAATLLGDVATGWHR